jgi:anthranilate synthase component 1
MRKKYTKINNSYFPSKDEFLKLAKKGNLIPVYKEILADLETPLSSFLKIDHNDYAYLLESVEGGENIARYSFLGSNPSLIFKSKGKNIEIIKGKRTEKFITKTDPLDELKKILNQFKFVKLKELPRFCGGLVGYIGYDLVRFFEKLPDKNTDDLKLPDSLFLLTDTILIFDHAQHTLKIISNAYCQHNPTESYQEAIKKIRQIEKELSANKVRTKNKKYKIISLPITSNFKKNDFKNGVLKAKKYISRGDIIQTVLSQRFKIPLKNKPIEIYRTLRSINPSPYMYYLKLKDFYLIGSSPEVFVRCEEGVVSIRPIAGTRKRGKTNKEDGVLIKSLLSDAKERAEHIMLVDLGRNDIGRVCQTGSVKLNQLMSIEKYSHVLHIVSEVKGLLGKGKNIFDLIRATFPAGTVTGAPKIRAMEIIDELELTKRGPYAGMVGYFSFSGNLDSCITIRTILVKDNLAYIQAGAGIVADSVPKREFQETINKAQAMFKAVEGMIK